MGLDHAPAGLPTWFGPHEAPLFGVVHVPDGGHARAGVVICPPLGKEHVDTYRGLKLLAQRLCARGFAVLRFDYAGTGDSALPQDEPSAVTRYLDSVRAAAGYLRAAGVSDIAVVGLRAGALLAGAVADSIDDLAALVLWDPVVDGRRYLREQQALYKLSVGDGGDTGGGSILGVTFAAEALAALKELRLPTDYGRRVPILVAARPDRVDSNTLTELAATPEVEVRTVTGQAEFVEPASFVVEIPVGAVYLVSSWLDATLSSTTQRVSPQVRLQADVAPAIRESIEFLGPQSLFAIRTTSREAAADSPALLIHNMACEHRAGSGRLWVESARELAAAGMTVVRYDRRGVGETGYARTDFPRLHSSTAKEDVLQAMDSTGVSADRLMMTGVCSGAWDSAYGALVRGARTVVMVNLLLFSLRNVEVGPVESSDIPAPGDGPSTANGGIRVRIKYLIRRWLPYHLWLLLGWLGLTQVPEVLLKALSKAGVSVDLVLSPEDQAWFEKQRGGQGVSRLSKHGWSEEITHVGFGDHSLLHRGIQIFTRQRLLEVAEREFGLFSPQWHAGHVNYADIVGHHTKSVAGRGDSR